jgi:hypothetical protein
MPEVHIVAEPVAGMCDHFTSAADEDDDQAQQQKRVFLGIDVGEWPPSFWFCTNQCLVLYYWRTDVILSSPYNNVVA